MKLLSFLSRKFSQWIARQNRPVMIMLKRNFQKQKIQRTRLSTSTFIDHPETLYLSDNIYIGHYNFIEASQGISIEEGVQITNFCSLTSHSSHRAIRLYGRHYCDYKEHRGYIKGGIHIGKYTFIGPHSLIEPGTRIGKGCLIAAYSRVRGEFPDFSIIAGNPAQVIGDTRDKDTAYLQDDELLTEFYNEWTKA